MRYSKNYSAGLFQSLLLVIALAVAVLPAHAQIPMADCALPAPTDQASKDFRNATFDLHIGGHSGMEQPRFEYAYPTDAAQCRWYEQLYGFTLIRVPGTTFTDLAPFLADGVTPNPNLEVLSNAILKRAKDTSCKGTLFDCLNIVAPGQFDYAVDFFFLCERKFEAAGLTAIVNFGSYDVYWTKDQPGFPTPWGRLTAARAQFVQVGIDVGNDKRWFSQFSNTLYVTNQRLNEGKLVIVGIYDLNRAHEQRARQIRDGWISLAPTKPYLHYNSKPSNADVRAQAFTAPVETPPPPSTGTVELGLNADFNGQTVYAPADNWWNLRVDDAPLDPNSAKIITLLKTSYYEHHYVHFDGGGNYGIPYAVVGNETPLVPVTFSNSSESDRGYPGGASGYPIPAAAKIKDANGRYPYVEAGGSAEGDRHIILYDRDKDAVFELSYASWDGSKWTAGYGAVFKVNENYRRPTGWTSTDAAGLCVLAGLVRYDEVYGDEPIRHATRISIKRAGIGFASAGYVWPASHKGSSDAGAPPMGMRFRLKQSVDISGYPAPIRRLLQSWKEYGLIVADRGGNLYVQATRDSRWDPSFMNSNLHKLNADSFEIVKLGWKPTS